MLATSSLKRQKRTCDGNIFSYVVAALAYQHARASFRFRFRFPIVPGARPRDLNLPSVPSRAPPDPVLGAPDVATRGYAKNVGTLIPIRNILCFNGACMMERGAVLFNCANKTNLRYAQLNYRFRILRFNVKYVLLLLLQPFIKHAQFTPLYVFYNCLKM